MHIRMLRMLGICRNHTADKAATVFKSYVISYMYTHEIHSERQAGRKGSPKYCAMQFRDMEP